MSRVGEGVWEEGGRSDVEGRKGIWKEGVGMMLRETVGEM